MKKIKVGVIICTKCRKKTAGFTQRNLDVCCGYCGEVLIEYGCNNQNNKDEGKVGKSKQGKKPRRRKPKKPDSKIEKGIQTRQHRGSKAILEKDGEQKRTTIRRRRKTST